MRTYRLPDEEALRSHEVLLTMARKLHAAVQDRDGPRFSRESHRFLDALSDHLAGEAHDLSGVPDANRAELTEGQHRLIELAQALVSGDPERGALDRRAERLLAMLHWQRDRERRAQTLSHHENQPAA